MRKRLCALFIDLEAIFDKKRKKVYKCLKNRKKFVEKFKKYKKKIIKNNVKNQNR